MAGQALSLAVPMYVLIFLGLLGRRTKLITEEGTQVLTDVVLYFCIPAMTIKSLMDFPPFSLDLIASLMLPILALTVIAYLLSLLLPRPKRGVFIQGAFRGNVGFMGLPIVGAWLGSEALSKAALLVAMFTPYSVLISILLLTYFESTKTSWLAILKRALLNPMALSVAAAFSISFLQLPVPGPVMRVLTLLGDSAFPMSVLVIGSSVSLQRLQSDVKMAAASTALKLLVLPLLGYLIFRVIPVSTLEMGAVITLLAMPAAVVSAVFAREFSSQEAFSTAIVLMSTLASPLTLSLVIYMGEYLGFFA